MLQAPDMAEKPYQHLDNKGANNALLEAQQEIGSYESCLNCLGTVFGSLRAWCPCICCCCPNPFISVKTSLAGILENFGKFKAVLRPGLHQINPCTEVVKLVDLKTRIIDLPKQVILTKDNITLKIDCVVYYRVLDPKLALYRVNDLKMSVQEVTISTLRTVGGEHTLQEILEQRKKVSYEVESFLYKQMQNWQSLRGIWVDKVFIKDMELSPQQQSEMSAAAKQKRIAESKIISAQADVESAKLLREAADVLDSKAAMQIRYLETLQNMSGNAQPKVLFLPLDIKKGPSANVKK